MLKLLNFGIDHGSVVRAVVAS